MSRASTMVKVVSALLRDTADMTRKRKHLVAKSCVYHPPFFGKCIKSNAIAIHVTSHNRSFSIFQKLGEIKVKENNQVIIKIYHE